MRYWLASGHLWRICATASTTEPLPVPPASPQTTWITAPTLPPGPDSSTARRSSTAFTKLEAFWANTSRPSLRRWAAPAVVAMNRSNTLRGSIQPLRPGKESGSLSTGRTLLTSLMRYWLRARSISLPRTFHSSFLSSSSREVST